MSIKASTKTLKVSDLHSSYLKYNTLKLINSSLHESFYTFYHCTRVNIYKRLLSKNNEESQLLPLIIAVEIQFRFSRCINAHNTYNTADYSEINVVLWLLIGQMVTIKASNWFKHNHHKPLLLLHSRILPGALWTLAKLRQSPLSYL